MCTVKPVNKGHPGERQNLVFIDKWSLFGSAFLFYLLIIKEELSICGLYSQDGLYWEVVFNTGMTVD